jgi:hypothetical protein
MNSINVAANKNKKKKLDFKTQEDVMQEFACEEESSLEDEEDEVTQYISAKPAFSKDHSLLEWWQKYSFIYPKLGLLDKSSSVFQEVQLRLNVCSARREEF